MPRLTILLLLLLVIIWPSSAQIETKILSPKKMEKDLEFLLQNIEAHPDPFAKINKEDFNDIVENVRQNISVELDQFDFYKNLAPIMTSIHDGHSRLFFERSWLEHIRKKQGVFPYEVYLDNSNELYVIKSYGDTNLPVGCKIIEINGLNVSDIIDSITPYISYETIPFRNNLISESFEFYLYLLFKKSDGALVKYFSTEEATASVSNVSFKEWKSFQIDNREERERKIALGKTYDYSIIKPGVAKIDIFSFSARNFQSYQIFLAKTFKEIRKENVHSLIIDVRGNYGGWPKIASELFHYISEGHFKTMAQSSMKISNSYRRYFKDYYPIMRNADYIPPTRRHYLDLHKILSGEINSFANEDVFFNEAPITKDYEFYGDCYLLIDRQSFSASSSFASTFQCYSMGAIIGEPTGGTKIFRANPYTRQLPNSDIIFSMSTTKLYTACFDEEDSPVVPNIEAIPSIFDRMLNTDSQLNLALLMIRRIQKQRALEAKNE